MIEENIYMVSLLLNRIGPYCQGISRYRSYGKNEQPNYGRCSG